MSPEYQWAFIMVSTANHLVAINTLLQIDGNFVGMREFLSYFRHFHAPFQRYLSPASSWLHERVLSFNLIAKICKTYAMALTLWVREKARRISKVFRGIAYVELHIPTSKVDFLDRCRIMRCWSITLIGNLFTTPKTMECTPVWRDLRMIFFFHFFFTQDMRWWAPWSKVMPPGR